MKLQATAARRIREADYTEEPNVKLSSAFVVVLVLHIVAVGGIYAFNAIKAHQPPPFEETDVAQPQQAMPAAAVQAADNPSAEATPAAIPDATRACRVKSGDTLVKIASANGVSAMQIIELNNLRDQGGIHVGQELKLPAAVDVQADAPKSAELKDSGNIYTVKSGDTPVGIARKLHVGFDELMRLNKIEDAKKLKIGMKLKVPVKHPAA
jgi:LysM repeat protein